MCPNCLHSKLLCNDLYMRFLFSCFTTIKFQGGWSLTRHVNNVFLSSPSWSIILCLWSTYFLRQSVQKGRLFEYTTKFNLLDTSLLETVQSSTSTTHQTLWEIRMVVWRNEVWFRIRGVKTIHLYIPLPRLYSPRSGWNLLNISGHIGLLELPRDI